jgi:hypothetical protein
MEEVDQKLEITHVQSMLTNNSYLHWMFHAPKHKKLKAQNKDIPTIRARSFPIPYIKRVSENLAKKTGYQLISNHTTSLETSPTPVDKKYGLIYKLSCQQCAAKYVRET